MLPGLPRLAQQDSTLRSAVVALSEKIQGVRHKAETDNRMIYFHSIPRDMADLPELPPRMSFHFFISLHSSSSLLLATSLSLPSTPYEQPTSEVVVFTFDPKRQKTVFNTLSSFFSTPQSTKPEPPPPSTATEESK
jgi:hypothetical protein